MNAIYNDKFIDSASIDLDGSKSKGRFDLNSSDLDDVLENSDFISSRSSSKDYVIEKWI